MDVEAMKFAAKQRVVGRKTSQMTTEERGEIAREMARLNPQSLERVDVSMGDEEAQWRLESAGDRFHKKCPKIRFHGNQLTVVPPGVALFKALTTLTLS